jgi:hypothetical protein
MVKSRNLSCSFERREIFDSIPSKHAVPVFLKILNMKDTVNMQSLLKSLLKLSLFKVKEIPGIPIKIEIGN